MGLSARTKGGVNDDRYINESDDLYPHATTFGDSPYTDTIRRLDPDEVPTTTKDVSRMMQWTHGDTIYGTDVKEDNAFLAYVEDINKGWGKENKYKDIYIDTFLPDIGKRLKTGDM